MASHGGSTHLFFFFLQAANMDVNIVVPECTQSFNWFTWYSKYVTVVSIPAGIMVIMFLLDVAMKRKQQTLLYSHLKVCVNARMCQYQYHGI